MKAIPAWPLAGLAALALIGGTDLAAQANVAQEHIRQISMGSVGTPNGLGLLATALAEADVALQHAKLAVADTTNLDAMRRHAGHVLHAIDPTLTAVGPGLGYGLRRAAGDVAQHIDLAAQADDASPVVHFHAPHVRGAAADVVTRSAEVLPLVQQIESSMSAPSALRLARRLQDLVNQLAWGTDTDGDGVVGWQEGEGGIHQAQYHLTLLQRAERPAP